MFNFLAQFALETKNKEFKTENTVNLRNDLLLSMVSNYKCLMKINMIQ